MMLFARVQAGKSVPFLYSMVTVARVIQATATSQVSRPAVHLKQARAGLLRPTWRAALIQP